MSGCLPVSPCWRGWAPSKYRKAADGKAATHGREVHSRSTVVGLATGTVCSGRKNREVSLVVPHEVDGSIAARNDWRTKLRFGEERRPQQRTRQFVPPRAVSTSETIYQWRRSATRETAEAVGFYKDLRRLILARGRAVRIRVFIAPHHRWREADYKGGSIWSMPTLLGTRA